jgi:hypothetical protein
MYQRPGLVAVLAIFPIAVSALLLSETANAFPEMVRHHYVNCNACHVDPNGGALLSAYGRGMSGEVLSSWHKENESSLLHGAIKEMPEWLNIGGDLRALQLHHENAQVREGRYILMQTQLEAALTKGPLTADVAYFAPDAQNHVHGELTHYYLMGNFSDTLQLKAGRFKPAFGINDPHHIFSTRQLLGFGYGMERDAVEGHYSGEQWHAALGWSVSRPQSLVAQRERAIYGQVEKFFSDSYRVGMSVWSGWSDQRRRWLASLHGIFGFTEHFYWEDETAWQNAQAKVGDLYPGPTTTGIYHFDRLGVEVLQGLHVTGISDISLTDVQNPNTQLWMLGGGPVWYPRPHFELELVGTRRRVLQTSQDWETYAYLMFHYYL